MQGRRRTVAEQRRSRNGRRVQSRRAKLSPQQGRERMLTEKERRHAAQILVCGGIFVLLVVLKILFPDMMAALGGKAAEVLEQNMDVQAVFSAVGQGISEGRSGKTIAEEVYQTVFGREEIPEPVAVERGDPALALELLHAGVRENDVMKEAQPEILYSDENVPEDVSMQQAILEFEYCTPVAGTLTSSFGYREHPVEGEDTFHYGVDLAAAKGTDIVCFADGTVGVVGESSSYGNYCTVNHPGGCTTLYAHCDRILTRSGASVKKGEIIAKVGETGMATGSHLHFELQSRGIYLNPIYYIAGGL